LREDPKIKSTCYVGSLLLICPLSEDRPKWTEASNLFPHLLIQVIGSPASHAWPPSTP
jgi:hypothetical protein